MDIFLNDTDRSKHYEKRRMKQYRRIVNRACIAIELN